MVFKFAATLGIYRVSGFWRVWISSQATAQISAIPLLDPTRRSLTLHKIPAAAFPLPRIRLAPSVRFSENLSRAPAKTSSTKPLLPITAPSVKYRTRQRSILAIESSGKTV